MAEAGRDLFSLLFVQSLRAALPWELPPELNLNLRMSSQMLRNFRRG